MQLGERRSAVARVACHLLSRLAAFLGLRFEALAMHFMPTLFKVRRDAWRWHAASAIACVSTMQLVVP